jgi:ribosomal protein S6--L-glutamate ligase
MDKFDYDIIVFTSGPKAYAPLRIEKECVKAGLKFVIIQYKEIGLTFNKDGCDLNFNGERMPTARSIFLRGLGEDPVYNPLKSAIVNWYKDAESLVLNFGSFDRWPSLDKTTQYFHLSQNNIPVVESFSFGRKENLLPWAEKNYPFIAKEITGSCGNNVFKIKNVNDLEDLFAKGYSGNIKIKTLLFQKFLVSGEDLRVIVLGGAVLGAMKRIAQSGQYLTNYSQGGQVEKYDIDNDKDAQNIALKVAKLFKLDYCGVDLMRDNLGNWVVLEVNRACQFEGFEKSTGINVAGKITEYLVK